MGRHSGTAHLPNLAQLWKGSYGSQTHHCKLHKNTPGNGSEGGVHFTPAAPAAKPSPEALDRPCTEQLGGIRGSKLANWLGSWPSGRCTRKVSLNHFKGSVHKLAVTGMELLSAVWYMSGVPLPRWQMPPRRVRKFGCPLLRMQGGQAKQATGKSGSKTIFSTSQSADQDSTLVSVTGSPESSITKSPTFKVPAARYFAMPTPAFTSVTSATPSSRLFR